MKGVHSGLDMSRPKGISRLPMSSSTTSFSVHTCGHMGVPYDQLMGNVKDWAWLMNVLTWYVAVDRKWTAAAWKPLSVVTLKSAISRNTSYGHSFKWCTCLLIYFVRKYIYKLRVIGWMMRSQKKDGKIKNSEKKVFLWKWVWKYDNLCMKG